MANWQVIVRIAGLAVLTTAACWLGACANKRAQPSVSSDADATVEVASVPPIQGDRVIVPGPWTRVYNVRKAGSERVLEQERRTASEVGADGRWQVRFERTPYGRTDWTLERTLTMTRTEDGIALVKFEDAGRGMAFDFEPALVLAPSVVNGQSSDSTKTMQGGDAGEASATITPLNAVDGKPRVRTTLTLVQGRTRVERVSELTLGDRGSVLEEIERTVRWAGLRVDHAEEVLEQVGE